MLWRAPSKSASLFPWCKNLHCMFWFCCSTRQSHLFTVLSRQQQIHFKGKGCWTRVCLGWKFILHLLGEVIGILLVTVFFSHWGSPFLLNSHLVSAWEWSKNLNNGFLYFVNLSDTFKTSWTLWESQKSVPVFTYQGSDKMNSSMVSLVISNPLNSPFSVLWPEIWGFGYLFCCALLVAAITSGDTGWEDRERKAARVPSTWYNLSSSIRPSFAALRFCVSAGSVVSQFHYCCQASLTLEFPGDLPKSKGACSMRVQLISSFSGDEQSVRPPRGLLPEHLSRAQTLLGKGNWQADLLPRVRRTSPG